jgi:hypothetical protein
VGSSPRGTVRARGNQTGSAGPIYLFSSPLLSSPLLSSAPLCSSLLAAGQGGGSEGRISAAAGPNTQWPAAHRAARLVSPLVAAVLDLLPDAELAPPVGGGGSHAAAGQAGRFHTRVCGEGGGRGRLGRRMGGAAAALHGAAPCGASFFGGPCPSHGPSASATRAAEPALLRASPSALPCSPPPHPRRPPSASQVLRPKVPALAPARPRGLITCLSLAIQPCRPPSISAMT